MIIFWIIHLVDGQKIVKHALYNYPVPILTSLIFFLHPTNSPKNFNQCMTTANSSIREAGRSKLCSYSILSNPFYLMTHHWHRQRCYVTQVMFLYIYTLYFLLFYSSSNTFLSSSFRKNKSSMKMKWSKLRFDVPHIHH